MYEHLAELISVTVSEYVCVHVLSLKLYAFVKKSNELSTIE